MARPSGIQSQPVGLLGLLSVLGVLGLLGVLGVLGLLSVLLLHANCAQLHWLGWVSSSWPSSEKFMPSTVASHHLQRYGSYLSDLL